MPASEFYIQKGKLWGPIYQAFVDRMYGAIGEPLNATSNTSLDISVATKTFTIDKEKSFAAGQPIRIYYNTSNYMDAVISSYDSTTGAMQVSVTAIAGSGTYALWSIGLVGSSIPVDKSLNILNEESNYLIKPEDISLGLTIVKVNASNGKVVITLPTAVEMAGKIILILLSDDPAGNEVVVNKSNGSEIYTGYKKGDFLNITSDGVVEEILDERVTVSGFLAKTSVQSIGANSAAEVWNANYSVEENVGGFWDAVLHNFDMRFPCRLKISSHRNPFLPRLNGSTSAENMLFGDEMILSGETFVRDFSTGDTVEGWFYNGSGSAATFSGAATKNSGMLKWEVVRRNRP